MLAFQPPIDPLLDAATDPTTQATQTHELYCTWCGDDVEPRHWQLGHRACLFCREDIAKAERKSWCVAIPYSKGAYQLITNYDDLKHTNPKKGA